MLMMIMYSSQQFSYAYAHNVHIFSLGSCRDLGVFQMYTLFLCMAIDPL